MPDSDSNIKIREHCEAPGLTGGIKAALRTIARESQLMAVAQLARRPVLGLSVWNEEALSCQSS